MMTDDLQPHQARIQKVGKVLWGFSWFWLVFNLLALLIVFAVVVFLGVAGKFGKGDAVVEIFGKIAAEAAQIPGAEAEVVQRIVAWDYAAYLDHFGLNVFYIIFATGLFVVTMTLILRIAGAWKRGDVFGDKPIRSFRILGWIYLVHGIIGQLWGMTGQFVGDSNTSDLIYFSFVRDVCLMSFATSGTGIEWGFLCLALSWILEHARILRDEQQLTV